MLRILVIIHEYPPIGGGGGAAARDICRGLARRGHEVRVLTTHYKGLPEHELDEGVDVLRLRTMRSEPFRASFLEMAGFILRATWTGRRLSAAWQPDIIHAHFAVPAGAAAWALSRKIKTPYLLTAHLGDVPGGVPEKTDKWFRWLLPFTHGIWKKAARVTAVSNYTRDLALRHYDVPVEVIPNGVDVAALAPRAIEVHDPPRIVFAGRFVEQKNPLQVPRVLATLKDLAWTCSMLGDGALFEATRTEVARLGLADRFHMPGWVVPQEVLREFSRSDLLFMPSRTEGLPVVGVQALASSLAMVVGRAGGFTDLVDPGGNGYLHDSDDAGAMSASLRRLLSDPSALEHARRRSLELASAFDMQNILDAYEHLLLESCA